MAQNYWRPRGIHPPYLASERQNPSLPFQHLGIHENNSWTSLHIYLLLGGLRHLPRVSPEPLTCTFCHPMFGLWSKRTQIYLFIWGFELLSPQLELRIRHLECFYDEIYIIFPPYQQIYCYYILRHVYVE